MMKAAKHLRMNDRCPTPLDLLSFFLFCLCRFGIHSLHWLTVSTRLIKTLQISLKKLIYLIIIRHKSK